MAEIKKDRAEKFLQLIEPILEGYPEKEAEQFRDYVKNPKTAKDVQKIDMMIGTIDRALYLQGQAYEDGVITPSEKEWLKQVREAVLSQVNPIMLSIQKQEEKKKAQKQAPKESLAKRVWKFLKNPKTVAMAALTAVSPLAAQTADEGKIDAAERNRPKITFNFVPQNLDVALENMRVLIKQKADNQKADEKVQKVSNESKAKIVPLRPSKGNDGK